MDKTIESLTHLFEQARRAIALKLHRGLIGKLWEDADRIAYCEAARLFTWAPHDSGEVSGGCVLRTALILNHVPNFWECEWCVEGTALFFREKGWYRWDWHYGVWRSLTEVQKLEAKLNV